MDLWKHQIEAIEYAMARLCVLLHVGMGCGKTRIVLEIIRRMIEAGPCRVLVGCPKAVMAAWAKQAGLWLPGVRILVLEKGTSTAKESAVMAALADTRPIIIVGNYETLWRMKCTESIQWTAIVWDEVHRLKSPSGAASKWAARVCKRNPTAKRIGLSGTMLSQSPLDAFGVWRSVESPECPTFTDRYTLFKAKFFQPHPHIRGAILGLRRDMEPEFSRLVNQTTFHRRSEDVLDLPPVMFEDVQVELGAEEAALYREVESEFCAVCDAGVVTTANALVAVLRLQQICGGYVQFDEQECAARIGQKPSKQAALEEYLSALSPREQVVVFCRFRSDIDSAMQAAENTGRTAAELSGRLNNLSLWQSGGANVLVAQIQAGGIGVDLTAASYGFFYSLGYSLSDYLQAVARLHRPGQTKTTHFYHLVAVLPGERKTVDGRVYKALSERKDVVDAVIEGYRNRDNRAECPSR